MAGAICNLLAAQQNLNGSADGNFDYFHKVKY